MLVSYHKNSASKGDMAGPLARRTVGSIARSLWLALGACLLFSGPSALRGQEVHAPEPNLPSGTLFQADLRLKLGNGPGEIGLLLFEDSWLKPGLDKARNSGQVIEEYPLPTLPQGINKNGWAKISSLKSGTHIRIKTKSGEEIEGTFKSVTEDSLMIQPEMKIFKSNIYWVKIKKNSHPLEFALIGISLGAIAGALSIGAASEGLLIEKGYFLGAIGGAITGAGVGLLIGIDQMILP